MKNAVDMGIIDIDGIRNEMEMKRKKDILKKYGSSIWYSKTEDCWYCHIPDSTKKDGRKKVKRKKKDDIENVVFAYWSAHDDDSIGDVTCSEQSSNIVTIEELCYEFMEYKKNLTSSGTVKRMMADWQRFYEQHPEFIQKPFRSLRKVDIDKFFNMILDEHNLKQKSFYNMCGVMKQMLQYAVDADYISKSPYRLKINKKKFEPTRKKPAAQEVYQGEEKDEIIQEMYRRLENNPSNTACLAVVLDFELGLRKGEILALRKSDIKDGWIHICRQLIEEFDLSDLENIQSKGFRVVEYTKSEDGDRWLPLTDRAEKILEQIEEINLEYGESYGDYYFVRNGYLMSPDAVDAQLKRGCQYIGMSVKTMHKIRKTYGSTLLHNGVNLSVVKDMLGHADESTTLRHYIFSLETDEEAGEAVRNALFGKTISKNSDQKVTTTSEKVVSFERFKAIKKLETVDLSTISSS